MSQGHDRPGQALCLQIQGAFWQAAACVFRIRNLGGTTFLPFLTRNTQGDCGWWLGLGRGWSNFFPGRNTVYRWREEVDDRKVAEACWSCQTWPVKVIWNSDDLGGDFVIVRQNGLVLTEEASCDLKSQLAHFGVFLFSLSIDCIQLCKGMPMYNFGVVVDDAFMGISHVLRAQAGLGPAKLFISEYVWSLPRRSTWWILLVKSSCTKPWVFRWGLSCLHLRAHWLWRPLKCFLIWSYLIVLNMFFIVFLSCSQLAWDQQIGPCASHKGHGQSFVGSLCGYNDFRPQRTWSANRTTCPMREWS